MANLKPLVFISGQLSELPTGDSVASASYGTASAGSGLYSTGDYSTNLEVGLALNPQPSGLIFTNSSLGVDGNSLARSQAASSSGSFAQSTSLTALASGNAALSVSTAALASGNAALTQLGSLGTGAFLNVTASAAVTSGTPVGVDDTGRVQPIRSLSSNNTRQLKPLSGINVTGSMNSSYQTNCYDPVNNKYFIAYYDNATSVLYGVVATKTSTSFTFGTPTQINTTGPVFIDSVYDAVSGKIILFFSDNNNNSYLTGVHITISGTSFTAGSSTVLDSIYANPGISCCYHTSQAKTVVAYGQLSPSQTIKYGIVSVSGSSLSISITDLSTGGRGYPHIVYNSTNNILVLSIILVNQVTNNIRAGTLSGTTISFGTSIAFSAGSALYYPRNTNVGNQVIVTWLDNSTGPYFAISRIASFTGTSVSLGAPVTHAAQLVPNYYALADYYDTGSARYVSLSNNYDNGFLQAQLFVVSGTTLTQTYLQTLDKIYSGLNTYNVITNTVDTDGFFSYYKNSLSYVAAISSGVVYTPTSNSMNNYLGIAQSTAASGSALRVRLPGTFDSNYSNLTPGVSYYLNPAASGISTTSSIQPTWSGSTNLDPNTSIGVALTPSVLLLSNPV